MADKEGAYCLYTTHIPVVRSKRPDPCSIVRWNTTDNVSVTKVLNTGGELLSALAVRYLCLCSFGVNMDAEAGMTIDSQR